MRGEGEDTRHIATGERGFGGGLRDRSLCTLSCVLPAAYEQVRGSRRGQPGLGLAGHRRVRRSSPWPAKTQTDTVSLILDATTANIAVFAIAAHTDEREAYVREVEPSCQVQLAGDILAILAGAGLSASPR
jgi:hypothetical protein